MSNSTCVCKSALASTCTLRVHAHWIRSEPSSMPVPLLAMCVGTFPRCGRVHPHAIKVVLPHVYLWRFSHDKNSPHLHNFSVHVPERGSQGTRLNLELYSPVVLDTEMTVWNVGPDTCENFDTFSINMDITELHCNAPDAYQLVMALGMTDRNWASEDDSVTVEQLHAIMSKCTLLKARSVRVKGVQLLISLMLIARSTNRQVMLH